MSPLDLAVFLAATCVAEISLQPSATECAVMWEVLESHADRRGIPLYDQTLQYCSYWKPSSPDNREWIAGLTRDGSTLKGGSQKRWLRYVATADRWLEGHRRICPLADHFGGTPGDGVGADDAAPCEGAVRVVCLPVTERQAYWDTEGCR
jgi:hypothetical protein